MISLETIKEFQTVLAEDAGVTLSDQEAKAVLADLVGFFDVLAQINHEDSREG